MNGNWGGIASRDFERMRADDHGGHGGAGEYDPSLDVINTIIASYAASNVDESEAKVINNSNKGPESPSNHAVSKREQNYYYDDHHHHAPGSGLVIPQKSSTPITPSQQQQHHESRYLHPLALKLKMQDSDGHNRNKHTAHSSEAQSNAATDNESDHRSETGDSFTQTNNEVSHAIMQVTKKLQWATRQLGDITSINESINAVKLISECALTISNLKQARGKN